MIGFVAATLLCWQTLPVLAGILALDLRCEYLLNPLGVDVAQPRLSWVLQSDERAQIQTAYQVLVASSLELLARDRGDFWDSGRSFSEQTAQIAYAGAPLQPNTRYWWKVRAWDKQGLVSDWSAPAYFGTGLLSPADWKSAEWIARKPDAQWWSEWRQRQIREGDPKNGLPQSAYKFWPIWDLYAFQDPPFDPAPLLRKAFSVSKTVHCARAYVCGLGYFEFFLNGQRVGDHLLDPGWTDYDKRVLYVTFDVTDLVRRGTNAVGVMLGRGWYNVPNQCAWNFQQARWLGQPKLIFRLNIQYADGSQTDVVSDPSWKTAAGPILFDSQRGGEIYDARQEKPGWSEPAFADAGWQPALPAPAAKGTLRAQMLPPIRAQWPLQPIKLTHPKPGTWMFELPQTIAGWPVLKVRAPRGTRIVLEMKESVASSGQQLAYVCKGEKEETIEGHFSYYGLQFITVTGLPAAPKLNDLLGVPVHTDVESVGKFECSHPLLNRIHQNVRWTLLNNLHSIPTDCPTREKLGWTGDAHLAAEAALFNFDMAAFYTKWCHDMTDAQDSRGRIPSWLPNPNNLEDPPTWSGACAFLPWYLYQYYGDRRILEEQYAVVRRYAEHVAADMWIRGKPDIVPGGPGDWLAPNKDKIPNAPEGHRIYGTAYYYHLIETLRQIAVALGKEEDARSIRAWAERIKQSFNREFFDPATGSYYGERTNAYRQGANAVALQLGLVPEPHRRQVLSNLVLDIRRREDHLATGLLGTKALMEILPLLGAEGTAYRLATQTTYPSWGWQVRSYGATTIPEWWNGEGTRNHAAFGSVGSYFFKHLAGIQPGPDAAGFKQIIIRPTVVGELQYVLASLRTIRGQIRCSWQRHEAGLNLKITIPTGGAAGVYLPKLGLRTVRIDESAKPLWNGRQRVGTIEGIGFIHDEPGQVVVGVASGSYSFQTRPP